VDFASRFFWSLAPPEGFWETPLNTCSDPHFSNLAKGGAPTALQPSYPGSQDGRCSAGICHGLELLPVGPSAGASVQALEGEQDGTAIIGILGGPVSGGFAHHVLE
jgi:hypothetical protein